MKNEIPGPRRSELCWRKSFVVRSQNTPVRNLSSIMRVAAAIMPPRRKQSRYRSGSFPRPRWFSCGALAATGGTSLRRREKAGGGTGDGERRTTRIVDCTKPLSIVSNRTTSNNYPKRSNFPLNLAGTLWSQPSPDDSLLFLSHDDCLEIYRGFSGGLLVRQLTGLGYWRRAAQQRSDG